MAADSTVMGEVKEDMLEAVGMVEMLERLCNEIKVLETGGWERTLISSVSLSSWALLGEG